MEGSARLGDALADECNSLQKNKYNIIFSEQIEGLNIDKMNFEKPKPDISNCVATPFQVQPIILSNKIKAVHLASNRRARLVINVKHKVKKSTCKKHLNTCCINICDAQVAKKRAQWFLRKGDNPKDLSYRKACFRMSRRNIRKVKKQGGNNEIINKENIVSKASNFFNETDLTSSDKSGALPDKMMDVSQTKLFVSSISQNVSINPREVNSIIRSNETKEILPVVSNENTLENMMEDIYNEPLINLLDQEERFDIDKELYKLGLLASAVTSRVSSNMFFDL